MSTKEKKLRRFISMEEYNADVVISVHPLMNDLPLQSCQKLSHETNKHVPFFTVVTDLGSGHDTWFEKDVEKIFIASTAIERLAKERKGVPNEKLVLCGLPIRYEFQLEAERLGDRYSLEGRIYQLQMRGYLDLLETGRRSSSCSCSSSGGIATAPATTINAAATYHNPNHQYHDDDRKVLLVMGGGEGVGSLSNIVHNLYVQCVRHHIRALILVVCGRNMKLKSSLDTCDWEMIYQQEVTRNHTMTTTACTTTTTMSMPQQHPCLQPKNDDMIMDGHLHVSNKQEEEEQKEEQKECVECHLQSDGNGVTKTKTTTTASSSSAAARTMTRSVTSKVTGLVLNPFKILSLSSMKKKDNDLINNKSTNESKSQPFHGSSYSSTSSPQEEKKDSDYEDHHHRNHHHLVVDKYNKKNDHVPSTCRTSTRSSSVSSSESSSSSISSSSSTSSVPTSQPPHEQQTSKGAEAEGIAAAATAKTSSLVTVQPLGFISNMAEYMVAADLLLTKAGPGTIAEAASLGLPVLLTSFLPGQEEGNIDFVLDKQFGEYIPDSNPERIATKACSWLNNPDKMKSMSECARLAGMPNAAEEIVKCIGKSVLRWKELHEEMNV